MAICKKYEELPPFDKAVFIGKLAHVAMNDDKLFSAALKLIERGEKAGMFDRVKFFPHEPKTNEQ